MKKNEIVNFKNEALKKESKQTMFSTLKKALVVLVVALMINNFSYAVQDDTTLQSNEGFSQIAMTSEPIKSDIQNHFSADHNKFNELINEVKKQIARLKLNLYNDIVKAENEIIIHFIKERNTKTVLVKINEMKVNNEFAIKYANEEIEFQFNRQALQTVVKLDHKTIENANDEVEYSVNKNSLKSIVTEGLNDTKESADAEINSQFHKIAISELKATLNSDNKSLINNANIEIENVFQKQMTNEFRSTLKVNNQIIEEADKEILANLTK